MQSKPGMHGLLHLYSITYICDADPIGFGTVTWRTWAYNLIHAEMKWRDTDPDWSQGWRLINVNLVD